MHFLQVLVILMDAVVIGFLYTNNQIFKQVEQTDLKLIAQIDALHKAVVSRR